MKLFLTLALTIVTLSIFAQVKTWNVEPNEPENVMYDRSPIVDSVAFTSLNTEEQYFVLMSLEDVYDTYHKKDLPKEKILVLLKNKKVYWRGAFLSGESGFIKQYFLKKSDAIEVLNFKTK